MDLSWPAIIGLMSTLWGGVPADADATPKGLLEAIYSARAQAERTITEADIYSDQLMLLFAEYHAEQQVTLASSSEVAPPVDLIPFDPLSATLPPRNLVISEPVVLNSQATATVSFEKGSMPVQLSIFMVEQSQGWRIDDVASFDANGQPWLLSWLLRYDPVGAQ